MEKIKQAVRVRYAPSPTGHLHIGGARTALFNYLFARKHGGKFIVRIEDTDRARHVEDGIVSQLEGLRWLGLTWDESVDTPAATYGPYRQTDRLALYQSHVDRMVAEGWAYPCYCTEEEVKHAREQQELRGETPHYNGKCRTLTAQQQQQYIVEGRKPSIRWRVLAGRTYTIVDDIRGHISWTSDEIGDWVICRADGMPTYNFAVVIDDVAMEISHVIRGEEHLSNTPRQCMVYEALGVTPPQFAHLPLILNEDRKKMSKRDATIVQFIQQYRDLGFLPQTLVNFMALLGWSSGAAQELFDLETLVSHFDLTRVSKSGAIFDTVKLHWMNNHYLRTVDEAHVVDVAIPLLSQGGRMQIVAQAVPSRSGEYAEDVRVRTRVWVHDLVRLYLEPMQYVAELVPWSELYICEEVVYEADAEALLQETYVLGMLQVCAQVFGEMDDWDALGVSRGLKRVQQQTGYKGKTLFMPVRAALTGVLHGRDLAQTLVLIGQTGCVRRLAQTIDRLGISNALKNC